VETEDLVSSEWKRPVGMLDIAKFPPSDKDKDGKPIDTTNVQYQESL